MTIGSCLQYNTEHLSPRFITERLLPFSVRFASESGTSAEPNTTRGEQANCRLLFYSAFLASFHTTRCVHGVETRFAFAELARAEQMRSVSSFATSFTIVALSFSALVQAEIPVTITNRCNHDL